VTTLISHVKDDKESIVARLDSIESMLQKYMNDDYIRYVRKILASYFRLINIYLEEGRISPTFVFPEVTDSMSRDIIEVLFVDSPLNTSQITDRLKDRRGSSSRRIVRERLQNLVEKGIVDCVEKKNEKDYMISEYAMKRWLKVLGIDIRSD